jgi:hypothetical protein
VIVPVGDVVVSAELVAVTALVAALKTIRTAISAAVTVLSPISATPIAAVDADRSRAGV